MKKLLILLLCIALLTNSAAFAADPGDGNIDGSGGGGMGSGSTGNKWTPGNDGVRITVVDARTELPVSAPVDFSNTIQPSSALHFGKVSKIHYQSGASIMLQSGGGYLFRKPDIPLPRIVSSTGSSNIAAIKQYFCSEYAAQMVANYTGFSYENLISGEYKLLIEPIAYFTYKSKYYCMTATEAALYNQAASGALRSKMVSLTHKNLPLSMFLEYNDLGFTAWGGARTGARTDADIINYLGIGIVKFAEIPDEVIAGEIEAPDVEYRTNTDVITSINLTAGTRLTPDNPATVTFRIDGRNYIVNNVVIPAGESQLVWVKWRTPSTPRTVNISITVSGPYSLTDSFDARIVALDERIPPDPQATDTKPGYTVPALPVNPQKTVAQWGVWSCHWVPDWVFVGGVWRDRGDWVYEYTGYTASLSATMSLMPDDIVPTASGKNMKSGYGVKTSVNATITTNAPAAHYTYTQTAFSTFPEFDYNTYLRLLQRTSAGMTSVFSFKPNSYSTYSRGVHFTPVWFPNGTQYRIYTQVWDTWTPGGMLSVNVSDYVNIQGSVFDDWYTSRD